MGNLKYFLIFLVIVTIFFVCPQKILASDPGVVINEIYPCVNTGEVEWIELFNSNPVPLSLTNYSIEDGTGVPKDISAYNIPENGYLILKKGTDFSFGLNDPGDIVKLKKLGSLIDEVTYGNWDDGNLADNAPTPTKGQSIARSPNGQDTDIGADFIIEANPTEGTENNSPPEKILPLPPANLIVAIDGKKAKFSWLNNDIQPLTFEVLLSENEDMSNAEGYDGLLNTELLLENLEYGSYYWQVIASNGSDEALATGPDFEVKPPVYSKSVIINEILPHPQNGADYEFIELLNSGTEAVDVSGWYLDDIDGGSTLYEIPAGTTPIPPGGYSAFYKTQTKLSLNDDGDSARLLFPDKKEASSCSYNEYAPLGLAWARTSGGAWAWTTEPTAGMVNEIIAPLENAGGNSEEELKIPVNNEVVEISTGNVENYRDYLVRVLGEITRTSGNTFYVDDGSGEVKVYIQDKTGINKPKMYAGDIFEIFGIVNLYREIFRILPQKQDDVRLINHPTASTSKTTTSKKVASAKTVSANTLARAPTVVKQVSAAETAPSYTPGVSENDGSSVWVNLIKMFVGLAAILLIIFVLRLRSIKNEKPLGADFGDDLT